MKNYATICTICAALLLLLCVSVGHARALEIGKPSFTKGDYWKYESTDTTGNKTTTTMTYLKDVKVTSNGTEYDCFVIEMKIALELGMLGSGESTVDTYVQKSTGNTVKSESYYKLTGGFLGGTTESYSNTTFNPPLKEMDLPMKTGKMWTYESIAYSEEQTYRNGTLMDSGTSSEKVNGSAEVLGEETVTVKAGTFTCLKLKVSSDETIYISPKVGYSVKIVNATGVTVLELVEYKYAKGSGKPAGGLSGFEVPLAVLALASICIVVSRKLR